TRGWFLTTEWSSAAALVHRSGYASSPKADACGRAAAAASSPRSRTGGGSPRRATASVTRSSTSRYLVASVTDRGARWRRRVQSGRAGPRRTRGLGGPRCRRTRAWHVERPPAWRRPPPQRDGAAAPALHPRGGVSWPCVDGINLI